MISGFKFENELFDNYQEFKEVSLTHRRFTHNDILKLIDEINLIGKISVSKAGESELKKEIFLLKAGTGPTKVFLWSQMHGDEATATMAIFDIINFFHASDDKFEQERKNIFESLTIFMIPLLNPDGAELFQRRNYFDIDINRDAIKQQSAEGRLLKTMFDTIRADFGFNLHDQGSRYSVGSSNKTAALSFLAPAYNFAKDINTVRGNAMKLIGFINNAVSVFAPGHIAKYSDDFEPRAFGDNFQRWGMSTILIESGGWKDDPEKQFLRKLNFISLLSAFKSISDSSYKQIELSNYEKIPFNEKFIYDLVLRNLKIKKDEKEIIIDLGINRNEINTNDNMSCFVSGIIEDIGDLSNYFGIEDLNLDGMEILPGQVCPTIFNSMEDINRQDFEDLYSQGYTHVVLNNKNNGIYGTNISSLLQINIIINSSDCDFSTDIKVGKYADFVIKSEEEITYICINGFLFNIKTKTGKILNGIITR